MFYQSSSVIKVFYNCSKIIETISLVSFVSQVLIEVSSTNQFKVLSLEMYSALSIQIVETNYIVVGS
jgi:hypothetical protein